MIQFILNQKRVQLESFQADTTLLDYLRLSAGLTGSKEGCASGDCGACTVVVAEPNDVGDSLDYKSLNSCICLLGSVHAKQVITVDGLRADDGLLHPVQQAMVDKHASQCGFCTPGFVMSIFAMSKQAKYQKHTESGGVSSKKNVADANRETHPPTFLRFLPERQAIIENIDGNLCRCTGYRPIIDATQDILDQPYVDVFDKNFNETLAKLKKIKPVKQDDDADFLIPESLETLSRLYQKYPDAKLLAGGTDLALDVTQGFQRFEKIIYLGKIKALQEISLKKDSLVIGAGASYQDALSEISEQFPSVENHIKRLGSMQIRNVATIGGNVANASPIGDMPPVLMALDARLVLQKGDQTRQVSMDDFYTGYKQTVMQAGEFLLEIQLPREKPDYSLHVYKVSKRYADDISAVCAVFYVQLNEGKISTIRIAFGGMAATVKRAKNAEKYLLNQLLNADTLKQAKAEILKDYQPLDDVRASREYRLLMAQNLLERLFTELGAAQ